MAYPFTPFLRPSDLKRQLLGMPGVIFNENQAKMTDAEGVVHSVDIIEHTINGDTFRIPFCYENDEYLAHSVVRSLVCRLKLNPEDFGLPLDDY